MSNANGDLVGEVTRYTPFGGYRSSGPNPITDRGFTGQKEHMADLGLYYYNARYYAPGMGRFLSADTLVPDPASPQSFNRYTYTLNNPVKFRDPSGHYATMDDSSTCGISEGCTGIFSSTPTPPSTPSFQERFQEQIDNPPVSPWERNFKPGPSPNASYYAQLELMEQYNDTILDYKRWSPLTAATVVKGMLNTADITLDLIELTGGVDSLPGAWMIPAIAQWVGEVDNQSLYFEERLLRALVVGGEGFLVDQASIKAAQYVFSQIAIKGSLIFTPIVAVPVGAGTSIATYFVIQRAGDELFGWANDTIAFPTISFLSDFFRDHYP